ncbi:extracellular solute-binding protein, family 1 [Candidatus Moduliflexus flocculans]|uniref:Extracellular solute-binding protein, family 1 n=1 Tax=Candidatus Moduliflexus flocculans TaxID=1499966 RepID=A0A0S6VVJ3_9BACT|nr:extracellular solute-binding protein, family 1 [Candidatus Moduliflexus flocculans]
MCKHYLFHQHVRLMTILSVLTCVSLFNMPPVAFGQQSSAPATVTIWGWDEKSTVPLLPEFEKTYPDIKINYVTFASDSECMQAFKAAYATGEKLPDIMWLEIQAIGEFLEMDIWERLDAPPYQADPALEFESLHPSIKNAKGELIGLRWDLPISGLAYRRELANIFFGTDEPEALEAMLPTWDAVFAKAVETRKQHGDLFLFASLKDAFRVIDGQNSTPMFDGDTMNFQNTIGRTYERLVAMRDAGLVDALLQWTTEWNASFTQKKHLFYPCPTWFPHFVIESNDPQGKGAWGMMTPPEGGFFWGGTILAIPKQSEEKEAAWKFLRWFLFSQEGGNANKQANGVFIGFKPLYDNPEFASYHSDWFGAQDLGQKWFRDIAPKASPVRPPSKYDAVVSEINNLILQALSEDPNMTLQDALTGFKEELAARLPELRIN